MRPTTFLCLATALVTACASTPDAPLATAPADSFAAALDTPADCALDETTDAADAAHAVAVELAKEMQAETGVPCEPLAPGREATFGNVMLRVSPARFAEMRSGRPGFLALETRDVTRGAGSSGMITWTLVGSDGETLETGAFGRAEAFDPIRTVLGKLGAGPPPRWERMLLTPWTSDGVAVALEWLDKDAAGKLKVRQQAVLELPAPR